MVVSCSDEVVEHVAQASVDCVSFGVELLSKILELIDVLLISFAEDDHVMASYQWKRLLEDLKFVEQAWVLQTSKGSIGLGFHGLHNRLNKLLDLLIANLTFANCHLFGSLGQNVVLDLKDWPH